MKARKLKRYLKRIHKDMERMTDEELRNEIDSIPDDDPLLQILIGSVATHEEAEAI